MRNHRHPDDHTADRLLAGVVDPSDAPPGFAASAYLFGRAAGGFAPVVPDSAIIAALADAIVTDPTTPSRKPMRTKVLTAKVALAAAAVVLSATTAAAATGTLPDAAQGVAANAGAHVGLNIPDPDDVHGKSAEDHGKDGEDHPTGTADNPTTADEHGATVSGTAHDTDATGADKGAAISTVARGDHGNGPDSEHPDSEGPEVDGASDAGTSAAP